MQRLGFERRGRIALAAIAASALVSSVFVASEPADAAAPAPAAPPTIQQRTSDVASADALPTIQIDSGYVWAQTTIGTTVYAAGSFSSAREAGTAAGAGELYPRGNVLAYDITTGALLPFAPRVNGVVKAITASPDGSRIYIGGSFNRVDDQARFEVAALDAKSGALITTFKAVVGGTGVYAMAATADVLYVGGLFTQAGGTVARKNLAAFSAASGATLGWAPTTDAQVDAMVMDPMGQKVIVGGRFASVNGAAQRGLAALDLGDGSILPWAAAQIVQNGSSTGTSAGKGGIFSLTADSGAVYGTGWSYAGVAAGNLEGTFAAEAGTGALRWVADCHGDHYGVYSTGKVVYATSHVHACETAGEWYEQSPRVRRYAEAWSADARGTLTRSAQAGSTYKDWSGTPSPAPYNWYPDFTVGQSSGLGQAGLSITGSSGYISIAGEFGSVNNRQFQGLVRFAAAPQGAGRMGPRVTGDEWTATAASPSGGTVQVAVPANWDRDDLRLHYDLYREGVDAAVAGTDADSTWWSRPNVGLTETGLPSGTTQRYRVVVRDGDGNSTSTPWATVTVSAANWSPYVDEVLSDAATGYWRLGSETTDAAANVTLRASSGVSVAPGGATDGTASSLSGTSVGLVASTAKFALPAGGFSTEAWVKTTSTRGGMISGYGSSASGASASTDRVLYLQSSGRVVFGVLGSAPVVVTSPGPINDGRWHHIVGTMGPSGSTLYVDGDAVGQNSAVPAARGWAAYARVGGDSLSAWPVRPASDYLAGQVDEVAFYPTALTGQQVRQHAATAVGAVPTPALSTTTSDLSVAADGRASRAASGRSITSTDWDFGDGGTATGETAGHTYAVAGTYRVTMTVTDDRGVTASSSAQVSVTAPNRPPAALFSSTVSGTAVFVDASASTDSDGSIAGYRWAWGDGSPDSSGRTAAHDFGTSGTRAVTLTVTDDRGTSTSLTRAITVDTANRVIDDVFDRMTSAGWGSATSGQSWSFVTASGASSASVAAGSGTVALPPSSTRTAVIASVPVRDTRSSVRIALDAAPSAGGAYAGIIARQGGGAADAYVVQAWMRPDGTVWLVAQRGSVVLATTPVAGLTRSAGDALELRVEVSGADPTTISAKLWRSGSAEPSSWQLAVTDSTAGLQDAGASGLTAYRSGSATSTGTVGFGEFHVVRTT